MVAKRKSPELSFEGILGDGYEEFRYGDTSTIHRGSKLDVETRHGKVVAVWFRCMRIPFRQSEVDARRAKEMDYPEDLLPVQAIVFRRKRK